MSNFENIFKKVDPDTAGTVPIPSSLDCLEDRDLAQRLATNVLGHWYEFSEESDPKPVIEVIEQLNVTTGKGTHTVANVKVTGLFDINGRAYSYRDVYCSHDLIFIPEDDENNRKITGKYRKSSEPCLLLEAAHNLKKLQIREEYHANPEFFDPITKFLEDDAFEKMIVDIIERVETGEWVGQKRDPLDVKTLSEILGEDLGKVSRVCRVLEHDKKIAKNGYFLGVVTNDILFSDNTREPSRLWSTYEAPLWGNSKLLIKVFFPRSFNEFQKMTWKVYHDDELYDVDSYDFQEKLGEYGDLPSEELSLVKRILMKVFNDSRPAALTSFELPIDIMDSEFINEGNDPGTPSYLASTDDAELIGWQISQFFPENDLENNEIVLVAHREGEEPDRFSKVYRKVVPVFGNMDWGLDYVDVEKVEEALDELNQELLYCADKHE